MAISLGTGLTPYMGRGKPRVVITGKFALGLVLDTASGAFPARVALAERLFLVGLATAAPNHSFSMHVWSRASQNFANESSDFTGLSNTNDYGSGSSAVYDLSNPLGGSDVPGSIRLTPSFGNSRWSTTADATSDRVLSDTLGQLVWGSASIVLTGKLVSLDLAKIRAGNLSVGVNGGFIAPPSGTTNDIVDTPPADETLVYDFPGYGLGTGWRTYSVRISDQPRLRGHVLNRPEHCKVIWE